MFSWDKEEHTLTMMNSERGSHGAELYERIDGSQIFFFGQLVDIDNYEHLQQLNLENLIKDVKLSSSGQE